MADKKDKDSNKDSKLSKDKDKDKSEKSEKIDLGLLEEDDEFEEFPAEGLTTFYVFIYGSLLS
jgi:hypothetical protein